MTSKEILYPLAVPPHSSHLSPKKPPNYFLSLWICLFRLFHVNRITHCVVHCVWLFSLSTIFSRFIHAVAWTRTSFPFHCQMISRCLISHPLFIRSSVVEHLRCSTLGYCAHLCSSFCVGMFSFFLGYRLRDVKPPIIGEHRWVNLCFVVPGLQ